MVKTGKTRYELSEAPSYYHNNKIEESVFFSARVLLLVQSFNALELDVNLR